MTAAQHAASSASLRIQLKVLGDVHTYAEARHRRILLDRLAAALAAGN